MIRNNIDFSHQSRIVLLSSIYVLMRERFCEITTDNEHVPIVFTLVSHRSQFPQCVTTTTSLLIWGILYLILSSLFYRRLMYVNYFDGILQLKHYPTSCRTLQFNKGAPFSFSKQALYPHTCSAPAGDLDNCGYCDVAVELKGQVQVERKARKTFTV